MKLRAFAAAWTLVTLLAAPPLLLAADDVAPEAPVPAVPAPGVAPAPSPAPDAGPGLDPGPGLEQPAPAESSAPEQPAPPAAEPDPSAEPQAAVEPQAAQPRPKRRRPVARAAASTTVNIRDFEFSPSSVTVNVGDTVTWVNIGPTVHTATGSGFDTGNLAKGESGSHTFTSAGTFSYLCTPHPFMKASVTVVAAGSGEAGDGQGAAEGAAADAGAGPSLADTGADVWLMALIGAGLLWLGVAVRRRARSA